MASRSSAKICAIVLHADIVRPIFRLLTNGYDAIIVVSLRDIRFRPRAATGHDCSGERAAASWWGIPG
jgi:hypothetical protein